MQKINIRNITLAILFVLILIIIALFIGKFTYSYLAPDVGDDLTTQGETTASGDTLIFSKGNDLSLSATTDNFNSTSGNLTDTTNPSVRLIASSRTNEASATYYSGIIIKTNTYQYTTTEKTAEIILTVKDENGNLVTTSSDALDYVTVNGVSGFDITNKTGAFNIVSNHPINTTSSTTGTTHTWTYTLTFVNLETDQSLNENGTLEIDVILQRDKIITVTKKIMTSYTSQGANGLYLHDATLANSANDGSYRYAGASVNNYVCFGSDATTCPEDSLYRIIGVFEGQIKLIKNTSLESMIWNGAVNTWSSSSLNTYLNGTYLSGLETKWQNMIATHTWQVGGMASLSTNTAKQYYDLELNSGTTYDAKIGLMYVSDYGFAADPTYWTTELYNYDTASTTNWMFLGTTEWTISRNSDNTVSVFLVSATGSIDSHDVYVHADDSGVRPSFYLESNARISGGSGTANDPYRIL